MKHTIEFNLPEDQDDLLIVMKASNLHRFHNLVKKFVRKIECSDFLHDSESVENCLDRITEELRQLMRESEV